MELTVTQENLARALQNVGRVASNKTQLPILNNILLRTDGSRLLLAATNLEIATTHYIGAKVVKQGSLTIPAKLVGEFVSSLPKGQITLKAKGNHLTISAAGYNSVINGVVADEFPELPTIDESSSVHYVLETHDLKQALSQTIPTSSNDSTRPILTGVYWNSHEGSLYLAATDGYRLSERRLLKTESDIAAIVPSSSLQEVLRVMSDEFEEIDVLFDEAQVRFRVGDTEITSRLIDGKYPDYRQLIPAESETVVVIPASEFTRITKVAGLFARESGGGVTITANHEAGTLSLHSIASELGENTSETTATVSADGVITLNSRYISEALSALEGDMVEFRFSGKLAPSVLTTINDDVNYRHVIMPLKS